MSRQTTIALAVVLVVAVVTVVICLSLFVLLATVSAYWDDARKIETCEAALPENQICKMVAVPVADSFYANVCRGLEEQRRGPQP